MKRNIVSLLILVFCSLNLSGQVSHCDCLYDNPEIPPDYKGGEDELMKYLNKEIFPLVGLCNKEENIMITSLYLELSIDQRGNLFDMNLIRPEVPASCKEYLKEKFLSMKGWTPGKINGKEVCSKLKLPISCILWK